MRTIALLLLLVLGGAAALAAPARGNVLTLSDGGRDAASARLTAFRARMEAQGRAVEQLRHWLVAHGALAPRAALPRVDSFVYTGTRAALPTTTRAENTLTLAYSGWTNAVNEQKVRAFLTLAYPVLVHLYGPPASNATLTITPGGYVDTEGGELTIDQGTGDMTLRVEPVPADFGPPTGGTSYGDYGFNLLHLVLHAFHAPRLMEFDAWEEGMARAAALVAITQVEPDYDVSLNGGYVLTLYDYLNQPGLSNATFFPASGISLMSVWRTGMAMSAWLKLYVEKPTVFTELNARYYPAAATLSGSQTGLKNLLASVVPSVEGTPTATWYDRQYILRPIGVGGNRLFVYESPGHNTVALLIHSFETNPDTGNEQPRAGTASLRYFSYDQVELFTEEDSEIPIATTGPLPGVGAASPSFYNIGDPPNQRIRISVTVGLQRASLYFPAYVAGYAVDEHDNILNANELFGAVVGADAGSVSIALPGQSKPVSLVQGAFSAELTSDERGLTYFAPVLFTVTVNGVPTTLRRNIGPGFYAALLRVGDESAVTLTHTFLASKGIVSFPLDPAISDPATLFGITAGTPFAMAWYNPAAAGTDKYVRYPQTLPAIVPGRAFWLDLPAMRTLTLSGTQLLADDPRVIELAPGWNLVGNTYNAQLNPWAMSVEEGNAAYPLMDAISRGKVSPLWTYDAASQAYDLRSAVAAWEGGWMQNLTGQTLRLRQEDAVGTATRGRAAPAVDAVKALTEGGWGVRLVAAAGASRDTLAVAGVATRARAEVDALDWQKPPAAGGGVRVAFVHPANRLAGAAYASDIRAAISPQGEQWEFEVSSWQTETVTLSWPDLRAVPSRYQLVLEDLATGEQRHLRTTAVYSFRAAGTPAQPEIRRFRLSVVPRGAVPLSFVSVRALPSRGNGADLFVTLSGAAELNAEIRAISGKLLRVLRVPATRANESLIVSWDGRATGGKLVPSGAYLIILTARTADGYVVRRVQPLELHR